MTIEELKKYEEEYVFVVPSSSSQSLLTDDDINEKYLKGEVRIVTEQARYPLKSIPEMFSSKEYILNPDFQRRHRWDVVKQSRLIESFIINVPIPPIFLYEKEFSVYEVMDGLQRITAIKEFYENKFELKGLEQWTELNGRTYSTLPEQIQKGIDRRYLSSIILLKETAKDEIEAASLKQLVFARINSGGAKLEDQESRNAQYPGKFNKMLMELARDSYFCQIFDIPQKTEGENLETDSISEDLKNNSKFRTMKDVETVLRFFALRKIDAWGDSTFTNFLDRYANATTSISEDAVSAYSLLFKRTIRLAYELFGDYTFCMWRENKLTHKYSWSKNPTMVMYDSMMCVLSDYINDEGLLVAKKEEIVERTKEMFSDANFANGRNTSQANLKNRIKSLKSMMDSICNL